jgi:transcriptional regulator of arginine metabolism
MVPKKLRQGKILEVIRRDPVHNQQELLVHLRRAGIHVTQATLSRDIKELGLVKGAEGYREFSPRIPYASEDNLRHLLREFLSDTKASGNLVILKTHQGCAQTVAVALDRAGWPELAGTLAGDDTILTVVAEGYRSQDVQKRIQQLVG